MLVAEIALATPANRSRVIDLTRAYLEELLPLGSEILPTDRSLATFARFFDAYVSGDWPGAVVLSDGGFTMAGQSGPEPLFDTKFGRMAYGWGTYVEPAYRRQGLAAAMRAALRDELRRQGFGAIAGAAHHLNGVGLESVRSLPFRFHQVIGIEQL